MVSVAFDCYGKRYGDKDLSVEFVVYDNGSKSYVNLLGWCVPVKCIDYNSAELPVFDMSNNNIARIRVFNHELIWYKRYVSDAISKAILVFEDIDVEGDIMTFRLVSGCAYPFEYIDANYEKESGGGSFDDSVFYSKYYSYMNCTLDLKTGAFTTKDRYDTVYHFVNLTGICHCKDMDSVMKDIVFNGGKE